MTGAENEFLKTLRVILARAGDGGENGIPTELVNELILAVLIDLNTRMHELEKQAPMIRVILSVGAVIGVSVIALIWSIIVGQAAVTFN